MTLRHIDPRSIDWMDAMLEGEPARRPGKDSGHEPPTQQPEPVETIAALQQASAPPGSVLDAKL